MNESIKTIMKLIYSVAEAFMKIFCLVAIVLVLELHTENGNGIIILLNILGAIWIFPPLIIELISYVKLLFSKDDDVNVEVDE